VRARVRSPRSTPRSTTGLNFAYHVSWSHRDERRNRLEMGRTSREKLTVTEPTGSPLFPAVPASEDIYISRRPPRFRADVRRSACARQRRSAMRSTRTSSAWSVRVTMSTGRNLGRTRVEPAPCRCSGHCVKRHLRLFSRTTVCLPLKDVLCSSRVQHVEGRRGLEVRKVYVFTASSFT